MATRDRAAHKEKEFIPATKLQLARSTPAVAGSGRSRSGRRRNDRSTNNNNNNAVVNSSGNSGRRHYHRRRNSDPSHHGDGSRARSPPARNTSPPVAAAVAAVAATAASAGTVAPTSTTTNSNTAKSASSAAVPPLPSSVVVPSFERVLTRRVDPALMPTTKRVCVMCETWLSGGAVEVPADADVFAHVSCLRCESCSLPVIDERKLKHLSAVSCFKKPGEHVFRCDVCSNGARSQRGRRAFSPRSPRGISSRRHRREVESTNDDLIEFDDVLISPRSRRRHRHSTARAREPREGDVGMMTTSFEAAEEDMLTYFMGDFITILACPGGAPMWRGRLDDGFEGLFRASHITVLGSRNSAQVRRARRQARGLGGVSLSDILKTDPDDVKDDDDYVDDEDNAHDDGDRRARSGGFFDRLSMRGSKKTVPLSSSAKVTMPDAAVETEKLSFLDMLAEEPPKEMLEKRATMNRSLREKAAASKDPNDEVVSLLDMLNEEPPPKTPRKPIEIVSLSDILAEGPPPGMVSPRKSVMLRKPVNPNPSAAAGAAGAAGAASTTTATSAAEASDDDESGSYYSSYSDTEGGNNDDDDDDSYESEEEPREPRGGPPVEMTAEERKKAVRAAAQRAAAAASAPVAASGGDARPRVTGKAAKLLGLEGGPNRNGAAPAGGAAANGGAASAAASGAATSEPTKNDEVVSWIDMLAEEPPVKGKK